MTIYRKLLIGTLLAASCIIPFKPAEAAPRITIAIGDRPYYTRGPFYWHNDVRYVWVPGHWRHRRHGRVWVRGKYVARERRHPLRRLERRHRFHRSMMFGG